MADSRRRRREKRLVVGMLSALVVLAALVSVWAVMHLNGVADEACMHAFHFRNTPRALMIDDVDERFSHLRRAVQTPDELPADRRHEFPEAHGYTIVRYYTVHPRFGFWCYFKDGYFVGIVCRTPPGPPPNGG